MRKKDILGNFVQKEGVVYAHSIRKLEDEPGSYSALINFLPGCWELYVEYNGVRHCLAKEGYKWLMYLPLNECWCITAFYSPEDKLIEWYFDISKGNFLDENGMPCIDDVFLDLVILPDGSAVTVDADELQEALDNKIITASDFDHAYAVHDQILKSKWNDAGLLTKLCDKLLAEYI